MVLIPDTLKQVKIGLDGQKLWTGVIGRVVKINYFYIIGRVEFRRPNPNSLFNNIPSAETESAFYTEPEYTKVIKIRKRAVFN